MMDKEARMAVRPHTEWSDPTRRDAPDPFAPRRMRALAMPAAAIGAVALGALAIGALAIGRVAVRSARIERLEIGELVLRDATMPDMLERPPSRGGERGTGRSERRGSPLGAELAVRAEGVPTHPNLRLIQRLDLRDIAAAKDIFAEDVVWHYFNPNLPELQGDYVGLDGIAAFFRAVGDRSSGTFDVEPISATPVGDELVVVHARDTLSFEGSSIALDVAVIWRFLNGRIAEVWDIVPGTPARG